MGKEIGENKLYLIKNMIKIAIEYDIINKILINNNYFKLLL